MPTEAFLYSLPLKRSGTGPDSLKHPGPEILHFSVPGPVPKPGPHLYHIDKIYGSSSSQLDLD